MPIFRHAVSLRMKDGLPENDVVNVWHTRSSRVDEVTYCEEVTFRFAAFYQALQTALARDVASATAAHQIKHYAVSQGAPGPADDFTGSPILVNSFTTPGIPTTGDSLPREVAVCLSLSADLDGIREENAGTRPASRRRGRVFIGPLMPSAGTYGAFDLSYRPTQSFMTTLTGAANTLADTIGQDGGQLAIYSRMDGVAYDVWSVSCDNAFDTVRSRGNAPSVRTIVTV